MTEELVVLTAKEVAQKFQLKISTIYSWLHYNRLPKNLYRKLGNKPRFILNEVEKWFINGAKLEPARNNNFHKENNNA